MATKKAPKKAASDSAKEAKRAAAAAKAAAVKAKASELSQGHVGGFMNFVRQQGVVGLAVGLAIGSAAGASVKTIVDELISPIVALLTRGVDLNSLQWVIMAADENNKEVAIGWGAIVSSLITLLATAFVVYQFVHVAKLDRIDKKKA